MSWTLWELAKFQLRRFKTIKPTKPTGREASGRALFKTVRLGGEAEFDCKPALELGHTECFTTIY